MINEPRNIEACRVSTRVTSTCYYMTLILEFRVCVAVRQGLNILTEVD